MKIQSTCRFIKFIILHSAFCIFNFAFLFLHSESTSAQNPDIKRTWHWYFGDRAGIDFSSGMPVADTNGNINVWAGCAAISDTNGNLFMYTDGFRVWNREHNIMPNGAGLADSNSTPFQSSIIIPKPGENKNIYYIFHLTAFSFKNTLIRGLFYSIVDMSLDSGRGDITVKRQMLLTPVSEALGAVYHENCKDVWIMAHKRGTNNFYAYLFTENGITDSVINNIGNFTSLSCLYGAYGLKFSPDGSKMVSNAPGNYLNDTTTFDTLHLFDFNRNTGILSNKILIPDTIISDCVFSPDNSKLYMEEGYEDAFTYQFDISSNNQAVILSTKNLIYYDTYYDYTDMQNTPDNKIIASIATTQYVSVINNPNVYGIACNVVDSALFLNGRYCGVSLPNFIQSYFDTDTSTTCFPVSIYEQGVNDTVLKLFPNPFCDFTNIDIYNIYKNSETVKIKVYDIIGKEIRDEIIIALNGKLILKRGNLNPGIYLLQIYFQNIYYLKKIIITN